MSGTVNEIVCPVKEFKYWWDLLKLLSWVHFFKEQITFIFSLILYNWHIICLNKLRHRKKTENPKCLFRKWNLRSRWALRALIMSQILVICNLLNNYCKKTCYVQSSEGKNAMLWMSVSNYFPISSSFTISAASFTSGPHCFYNGTAPLVLMKSDL